MEEKTLKILVLGRTNSGKTTVARLIEHHLKELEFTDVHVKDLDPTPDKPDFGVRIQATKARRIDIEVGLVSREGVPVPPFPKTGESAVDERVSLLNAFGILMAPVLQLIQKDPHNWSKRPCSTCSAVSSIVGVPFGCVSVAMQGT